MGVVSGDIDGRNAAREREVGMRGKQLRAPPHKPTRESDAIRERGAINRESGRGSVCKLGGTSGM